MESTSSNNHINASQIDNLIELTENHKVNDLSEFDPLANEKPTQPKRPVRPPPPPPTNRGSTQIQASTNRISTHAPVRAPPPPPSPRSHTVSGTSSESVLLKFNENSSAITKQPARNPVSRSDLGSFKNKSASFVSYLSSNENDNHVAEEMQERKLENRSASSPDVTHIGNSQFVKFEPFDGASGHNEMATKFIGQREQLMQLLMAKRQDDYTKREPFRIFAGTWNVNGQFPTQELDPWVGCDEEPPDIYLVGFQELDLSKEAFVFAESAREEEWLKCVKHSLHPKAKYRLIKLNRLVGMMLLVFAQERHVPHITNVIAHQVGTGLLGKMGNKGGVGVRFDIHSSTICVVNSHLAAHSEEVQRRNQDYSDICQRMRFADPQAETNCTVLQHDVLIWLGDLNYRIDHMLPDLVKELIEDQHYKPLLENDQLLVQRRVGSVFKGFEEGDLTFRPTYKYNPGTDQWDTSEKCRMPAWCDRILWRESALQQNANSSKKPFKAVNLLKYRSHPALKISDHKPVSALFKLDVKIIDQEKYRKVYEEEIRRLDRLENEWLPTMALSNHTLDFGVVKFQCPSLQTVELHNTGQTPCHFEFIGKLGDSNFCKPWLTVSKPKGYVMPGEKVELEFEVYVNKNTAPMLNRGQEGMDDILILHLVGGKDFFITLTGKYSPSCFGTSIEALCRMNKPITLVEQKEIARLSTIRAVGENQLNTLEKSLQVPKELWWILDHLHKHARHQPDLFQQPGLHQEFQKIQESLDSTLPTNKTTLPGSNHSVAEALLLFLEALPEPVIPFQYYTPCLEVAENLDLAKELLKTMSSRHRSVFYYLLAFLQELLKYKDENNLNDHLLGTAFSGLLLRPGEGHRKTGFEARIERQKSTNFIKMFLRNKIEE
uniref:phosphoinositide 5-phosphatase n=1 Tax=Phallusia mammillata TaxID=59560 RepID=A0A6F9DN42_9ASCI|nr:inositol polyphosphate 5-phosphatase OCRL-1 [Phallusia mammillata]